MQGEQWKWAKRINDRNKELQIDTMELKTAVKTACRLFRESPDYEKNCQCGQCLRITDYLAKYEDKRGSVNGIF